MSKCYKSCNSWLLSFKETLFIKMKKINILHTNLSIRQNTNPQAGFTHLGAQRQTFVVGPLLAPTLCGSFMIHEDHIADFPTIQLNQQQQIMWCGLNLELMRHAHEHQMIIKISLTSTDLLKTSCHVSHHPGAEAVSTSQRRWRRSSPLHQSQQRTHLGKRTWRKWPS